MSKLYKWIRAHKVATAVICITIFALQAIVVHALHKWYVGVPWLAATWSSGDMLAYVAGFEAFLGTIFLGLVSLEQNRRAEETNKRLSEENNYLQRIMSQKLVPVVKICSLISAPSRKNEIVLPVFPKVRTFTKMAQYNSGKSQESVQVIRINVDVESGAPAYIKTLTCSVFNVSEAIIRHFCVDDIEITGYQDTFSPIHCLNEEPRNGISSLFSTGNMFTLRVEVYFNSEEKRRIWDSDLGGLAMTIFSTNTTITGIQFHEFMGLRVLDTGYSHVSYGEETLDTGGENNA